MTRQNDNRPKNVARTGEKTLKRDNVETFPEEGTDETLLKPEAASNRPLSEAETLKATRKALEQKAED